MTDDEVLEILGEGNVARAAASSAFRRAYDGAENEVAKCWAAHMVAVMCDSPEEKLGWNMESLRAAEAATGDPRAGTLFPAVLGNIGFSTLLMGRPAEARRWYQRALESLVASQLPSDHRAQYLVGIQHMIEIIDAAA
jgi:hypothetical protein